MKPLAQDTFHEVSEHFYISVLSIVSQPGCHSTRDPVSIICS